MEVELYEYRDGWLSPNVQARVVNLLYELADGSFNQRGMSLSAYLDLARSLSHHLTVHHTIEERYIFPILGKRMKEFSKDAQGGHDHLASHKAIHDGIENLGTLISKYKADPTTYSPSEMRTCLDNWRGSLFNHLDEEVADLRGENLKKYFTLEEVENMPM
ncbi:hypothetical protein K435DRAFT_966293 [Dendrothele bispora CBS 962.96]|uniref:Hemerythrin-like domain-containing protein n=1 Tax=Dendrothele bispora (strain CBS 962.96) TaxID=1314807 RepID=A0A4S8M162_DENBC|nr:hypothetical protein K435DRAFT_966293 [Dendrothele bispora CBS 962.96]